MKKLNSLLLLLCLIQGAFAQRHAHADNLVIISVDGLRWQELFKGAEKDLLLNAKFNSQDSLERIAKYWSDDLIQRRTKLMPFTWHIIAKQGQIYGNRDLDNKVNVKNPYWISYPGRSENLTGYADPKVKSNNHPNNGNKNILEFIDQKKGYKGKVVSFASWDAVGRVINRERNGLLVNIPGENIAAHNLSEGEKLSNEIQHYEPKIWGSGERLDATTYALAKSYMRARHPKVVYLDLADTDEYGHSDQYDFYLDATRNIDAMINSLWSYLQEDPFYKDNTVLMVMPDHGRGVGDQWTSHGASIPHADETWLIAMGPHVKNLGEIKSSGQIYHDQFAKTMVKLLGFDFTSENQIGEIIDSLLK
ncbi:alkaline phosphatase family protein [Sphingobacterium detergens]|uniref:Phosphopentomutase/2, 3-bisphosphoglycerate-independent phosphoglycerate mutase family metalloenzyme n=1 Tax=Sphingobacterium detergens TaxID=1145106 RepID=A0A420BH53_SPHD1|nr:alkaline phosphatase family protein [Sphingobacterium detergens]RKE56030.1 phosphopentomutase/2,3-bisphosphoglycerate-independent phosphoglycerate mutase family metalloenzyme [Sphingobacterium detergens]